MATQAQGRADPVALAEQYARDVVAGRIVAGKWVRLACKRQLDDLKRWGKSRRTALRKGHPYYFSAQRARRVCALYDLCEHVEGDTWAGQPIRLEPWQCFVRCVVYGWVKPQYVQQDDEGWWCVWCPGETEAATRYATRTEAEAHAAEGKDPRRYREVYESVARKNAKTTGVAPLCLYALDFDGESGPGVYSAATTRDQAHKVWGIAEQMVQRSEKLQRTIKPWAHHLSCERSGGIFKPLVSRETSLHSLNSHFVNLDELHVHQTRRVYRVMKTSMGARRQPLLWSTTTAGESTEGICWERRTYGCWVLEGIVADETMAAFIYEPDDGDDPYSEDTWRKGNPNLGVSKSWAYLRNEAAAAQASPAAEAEFKRLECNIWVHGHSPWLDMQRWMQGGDAALAVSDYEGCAYIGADMADTDDIASVVLALFDEEDYLTFWGWHFIPEAAVTRHAWGVREKYPEWAKAGHLITTPGDFIDHAEIEALIQHLSAESGLEIRRRWVDQYGGARTMASRLTEAGYETEIQPKNAKTFTEPANILEARVRAGRVRHDGNPVFRWMAANCVVSRRVDGSLIPKKERSDGKDKIDGIDALCLAIGGYLDDQEPEFRSVYEERGLLGA